MTGSCVPPILSILEHVFLPPVETKLPTTPFPFIPSPLSSRFFSFRDNLLLFCSGEGGKGGLALVQRGPFSPTVAIFVFPPFFFAASFFFFFPTAATCGPRWRSIREKKSASFCRGCFCNPFSFDVGNLCVMACSPLSAWATVLRQTRAPSVFWHVFHRDPRRSSHILISWFEIFRWALPPFSPSSSRAFFPRACASALFHATEMKPPLDLRRTVLPFTFLPGPALLSFSSLLLQNSLIRGNLGGPRARCGSFYFSL